MAGRATMTDACGRVWFSFPPEVERELKEWFDDNRTGNFTLHMREGEILGASPERKITVKSRNQ